MRLPLSVEYALRAAVEIGRQEKTRPVSGKGLSKKIHVPSHFLSKILRNLVTGRILRARRGPHGGFVLARPPQEIRILDVLNAISYPAEESHCLFGWKKCGSKNPCPIHDSWVRVKDEFAHWARNVTLKDLV